MVLIRKYSLFGMQLYHRILLTLSFSKFHPTDTIYLKIALFILFDIIFLEVATNGGMCFQSLY